MSREKKLAVITGCDSGIGKSLCAMFAKNNYNVAMSYLEKNPYPSVPNIFPYKMDLRNAHDIESFFSFVNGYCKQGYRLVCFINNAGVAKGGPIENIPLQVFREVFEINFFGLVSLTQKMIPNLIQSKGRLIIIGSMAGRIAPPFLSPYVCAKFALEGFSDSLRRELTPFGIKTILLEPGFVTTPIWNKLKESNDLSIDKKYLKSLELFKEKLESAGKSGMKTSKATEKIFKIIKKKYPKPRYFIVKNRLRTNIQLFLPQRYLDKLIIRNYKIDFD